MVPRSKTMSAAAFGTFRRCKSVNPKWWDTLLVNRFLGRWELSPSCPNNIAYCVNLSVLSCGFCPLFQIAIAFEFANYFPQSFSQSISNTKKIYLVSSSTWSCHRPSYSSPPSSPWEIVLFWPMKLNHSLTAMFALTVVATKPRAEMAQSAQEVDATKMD